MRRPAAEKNPAPNLHLCFDVSVRAHDSLYQVPRSDRSGEIKPPLAAISPARLRLAESCSSV